MARVAGARIARAAAVTAVLAGLAVWIAGPAPLWPGVLAAGMLALTLTRPGAGLLAFAALAPFTTILAIHLGLGGPEGWRLLLVLALAFAAGSMVRVPATVPTRTGPAALLVAVVAVGSAVVQLPGIVTTLGVPGEVMADLADQFRRGEILRPGPVWPPIMAASLVTAGMLLLWCVERTVRDAPDLLRRGLVVTLAAHAGAALLSLSRIVAAATRGGGLLADLPGLLATVRVSMQMDLNAAGSTLVLATLAGIGLVAGGWGRRLGLAVLVAMAGLGVWISGSRTALVAGLGVAVVGASWQMMHGSRRTRLAGLAVAAAVAAAGIWGLSHYPAGRNLLLSKSVATRLLLARAGADMLADHPVFGIGIARFYETSAALVGPRLEELAGLPRENAHNNFVQVLAEQGLVGLTAFVLLLATTLVPAVRSAWRDPAPARRWLLLGIVACLLTWLTGHPLLVPEFALVFWMYFGLLAASLASPAAPPVRRAALPALAAVVVLTIPWRAGAWRDQLDLEHQGLGVSLWQHDDAQRYREAGPAFALFLPASGHPVVVPVRRAPGAPDPVTLRALVDGRLLNAITLGGDRWTTLTLSLPSEGRRFERVDFEVAPGEAGDALVRVGRAYEP